MRSNIFKLNFRHNFNLRKTIMTTTNIEKGKAVAAKRAVEDHINLSTRIVGVGSGSTISFVVEELKHRCSMIGIQVQCIPTSNESRDLIHKFGLIETDLDREPIIDVTIDGADEVDSNFVAIKGGGACHLKEKVVAAASKVFVVVADDRKDSKILGQTWKKGIPIEVVPMAKNTVTRKIAEIFQVDGKTVTLRTRDGSKPLVTENGNLLLDWQFDCDKTSSFTSNDWQEVSDKIKLIPGVIEVGIFAGMINDVYFGHSNGEVTKRNNKQQ